MTIYRSLLFVPGTRPDRFDRAAEAGSDGMIIDLEDAVAPDDKGRARSSALDWLKQVKSAVQAGLRINSPRTQWGCVDIAALAETGIQPAFVMVPKAHTGADVDIVREALGGTVPVLAVIESARGLEDARSVADAADGVLFGGADLAAELGVPMAWEGLAYARGRIVAATAQAHIPAYDVPFLDVKDLDGLAESTRRARDVGFSGRACIHPSQIETVNDAFTPSPEAVAEAEAIIAAYEAAEGGVALHDNKMIDAPIVLAARRLVAKPRR
jgi:citrate lyase subunit beta/citryl-CoA lyase/(S)-citramalyl-CoA lyase